MTKGFTLIETIIAISLLTTGVVGSFALMQRVTSFTSISSSQFIASYLAQEGIEIIRNIRDTNYLELQDWDGGIDNANTGADFRLDYSSEEFPDMTCGNYLQHDGNYYVCSDEGKFQRKITITKEPALKKMVVSVDVSWSERGVPYHILAETELYNWR